jgi:hypothetical protein
VTQRGICQALTEERAAWSDGGAIALHPALVTPAKAELAANRLGDDQRQAAEKALYAISQTVAAWDETLSTCHAGKDGYVWLGDFARNGSENPDKKLEKFMAIWAHCQL